MGLASFTNKFGTWTGKQREDSLKLTKKAIADGVIPSQYELGCKLCGQKHGRIDYHNKNYDHPTKFLVALCSRCHLVYHHCERAKNKDLFHRYISYIEQNGALPPIKNYQDFFSGLNRGYFDKG